MTSPARNYPFGPILNGEDVILIKGTNVAILMENTISFVPITSSVLNTNILVLKVTGTPDKLIAKVKLPVSSECGSTTAIDRYLTPSLTFSSTVVRLKLESKYSVPPSGYSLFSGVDYTIANTTNTLFWVATSYSHQTTKDLSTAYCTTPIENPVEAAKIFLNKTVAFTRLQDCERNSLYNYCLTGETCGSCYGICDGSVCHYSSPGSAGYNGNPFMCSNEHSKVEPDLPINLQGWFIIIVIILVLIAIGIALYYSLKDYSGKHSNTQHLTAKPIGEEHITKKTTVVETT